MSVSQSGVSFTFFKKTEPSKVKKDSEASTNEEKKDFVLALEGKEIHSTLPKAEKKEIVIPLIGKNKWRLPPTQSKGEAPAKSSEENALDREAAEAVLRDLQEAQIAGSDKGNDLVVPLLMQNKPPVVKGKEKDELADVDLRPEQSTLEDYETVPIESFGEAALRGMGWTKGAAIGLTNKGLVEPIEFIPRLGGLGLGATPRAPPPELKRKIRKPGEVEKKVQGPYVGKDGRVKYYKKVGEEIPDQPQQGFCIGNYAKVLRGAHEHLYGKIVSVDDDTARVVLKMAINNQTLGFSQYHLELVDKEEYQQRSRAGGHKRTPDSQTSEKRNGQEKQFGLVTKRGSSSLAEPNDPQSKKPSPKRSRRDDDDLHLDRHSKGSRTRTSHHHSSEINREPTDYRHKSKSGRDSDAYDQHDNTTHRTSHQHKDTYDSRERRRHVNSIDQKHSKYEDQDRSSKDKRKGHEDKLDNDYRVDEQLSKRKSWIFPSLRVRMVDQRYKKGKYYNTKVVILDVIRLGECVCQDESGKLLEGITESMLETVVPRSPSANVMIVGGKSKGKIATIIEQDRPNAKAVVEISLSKKVFEVDFDDICEYTGLMDDV